MRFNREASVLALMALVAAPAAAQLGVVTKPGVMVGANFAKLGGDDVGDVDTRSGFAAGGFLAFELIPAVTIQPELYFSQKGAEDTEAGAKVELRLSYLELPVLAKVSIPAGGSTFLSPHLYAGPALGLKVGCSVKTEFAGSSNTESCDDADVDVKGTDFGVLFGAGVDIGNASISGRYDLGLSSIDDSPANDDVKNRVFSIVVGYSFGPRR